MISGRSGFEFLASCGCVPPAGVVVPGHSGQPAQLAGRLAPLPPEVV